MTTVLIVDDQIELRSIHGAALQNRGYSVLSAADGPTALATARAAHPDIIVLDHSLPGLTGVEVATKLRDDPRTADIPIIMMTAHAYGAVGRKARAAGCVAFLAKPCTPRRLLTEIERHGGTPRIAAGAH
jgi:CheY-like chemotaxis protein